jgi:hypothetical protein
LYCKLRDEEKLEFDTLRIFNQSAARAALADFNGDGNMDFATTGYNVRFYYEDKNPKLYIHLNNLGTRPEQK